MFDVDLNLLTALDALLAEGNVAKAARRLGLSGSAMSRTLARLRATTGDPLLVRAGRGLVPTPHAVMLREQIGDLVRQARCTLSPPAVGLDLTRLARRFTIRTNEGFVDAFAARLVAAVTARAPGVRLHFAPKPDKDVRPLREGMVDLEIGVLGETGPEVRLQTLFQDAFVGAVRAGHPLLTGQLSPERYAACGHVVASRRGLAHGPVDVALAALGLSRNVAVVVPGFPAALAIARSSDLVALVTASFVGAEFQRQAQAQGPDLRSFVLPVSTSTITISQMWHPRMDNDPAHRWLRGIVHGAVQAERRAPAGASERAAAAQVCSVSSA